MTLQMPGKFTLGAAAALLALVVLFLVVAATAAGPVEGSNYICEGDAEAITMSCTSAGEDTSQSTPTPTFDAARWMPVPAVLHDGTLSRYRNPRPSSLAPPRPPIDGFEYYFDLDSGSPTSEEGPGPLSLQTDSAPGTSSFLSAGNTGFYEHKIIVETPPPPPLPPAAVWFGDWGHGESHRPLKQSRMRVASGPFWHGIVGYDPAADSPQDYIESSNTYVTAAWNRLKAFTFDEEDRVEKL